MKRYLAAAAISLAVFAPAASAAPEVRLTQYSKTITGSIGTAAPGVEVSVNLDGHTVETLTNASGEWSADLPVGVKDWSQTLSVTWTHAGTHTIERPSDVDLVPYLETSVNAAGTQITVDATDAYGFDCPDISYEVRRGADLRSSGTLSGSGNCAPEPTAAAIDPAQDRLSFKSAITAGDGTLRVTMPGAVPGGGGSYGGFPGCYVGLTGTTNLLCFNLPASGYTGVRRRASSPDASAALTEASGFPGFTQAAVPGGFAAGDTYEIRYGSFVVTSAPVHTLRADVVQGSTVSGSCSGGTWITAGNNRSTCSDGSFSFNYNLPCSGPFAACADLDSPLLVALGDAVTQSITYVAVPVLHTLVPGDHASVGSDVLFFADATWAPSPLDEEEDTTSPVSVELRPEGGGAVVASAGGANSGSGARVNGLAAGRYDVAWTLTDAHGNTARRTTDLVVQPGTPQNSAPAAGGEATEDGGGQQGPPPLPAAPTLPTTADCDVIGKGRRRVRCKVSPVTGSAKGRARLVRRRKTIARGRYSGEKVTLKAKRRLASGRYTLVVGGKRLPVRL